MATKIDKLKNDISNDRIQISKQVLSVLSYMNLSTVSQDDLKKLYYSLYFKILHRNWFDTVMLQYLLFSHYGRLDEVDALKPKKFTYEQVKFINENWEYVLKKFATSVFCKNIIRRPTIWYTGGVIRIHHPNKDDFSLISIASDMQSYEYTYYIDVPMNKHYLKSPVLDTYTIFDGEYILINENGVNRKVPINGREHICLKIYNRE